MFTLKLIPSFFVLGFLFISCEQKEFIPKEIGGFRVVVTPPGNEFYEAPSKEKTKTLLPQNIEQLVKIMSPNDARISSWKVDEDGRYSVHSIAGDDRYYFTFSDDGKLRNLRFKNYALYKDERGGRIIIKGSRKKTSLNEVPHNAVLVLNKISSNLINSETYKVKSAEGMRYVVVDKKMAYFIRLDGQIQAAALVEKGALKENDSSNMELLKTNAEVLSDCESLLSEHKNKFNFELAIKKLKDSKIESPFRFIVMGDNRSNEQVWFNLVKHINQLHPKPAFIVNSGDVVPHGYAKEFANYFIPPLLEIDIPIFIALGNHDCGVRDSTIEYQYLFGKNSLNLYFDLGKFRFIMFDNASRFNVNGEALPWLEKTLSETPKRFSTIVFAHQPPAVIKKWDWHSWDKKNSQTFVDLMAKYNTKHVFLGHIHGYSTATFNSIPYTVSGGGGAELRGDSFGEEGNVFHYIICDAMSDGTIKQKVVKLYKNK